MREHPHWGKRFDKVTPPCEKGNTADLNKHPHYDLIVKWASDPDRWGVQRFCSYSNSWFLTANQKYPTWVTDHKYRLIDRYAEPITEEPQRGENIWRANPCLTTLADSLLWTGIAHDYQSLQRRLLYRTREAAEARAREIIESGGGEV